MGVECAVLFHAPHGAVLGVVSGQHAVALSIQNPDVLHILALYIALLCQLCLDAVAAEILVGRVVSRAVSVFIAAALVHPHQPAIGKAGQGVVALPPCAGCGKAVCHGGKAICCRVQITDLPALVVTVGKAAAAALGQDLVVVSVADQVALFHAVPGHKHSARIALIALLRCTAPIGQIHCANLYCLGSGVC